MNQDIWKRKLKNVSHTSNPVKSDLFYGLHRTIYQDIELYDPQKDSATDHAMDLDDDNQQENTIEIDHDFNVMKGRLDLELEKRKEMAANVVSLREKKIQVLSELKRKESELEALESDLEKILKDCVPLDEKLELNLMAKREKSALARSLPDSLFTLYSHIYGYLSKYGIVEYGGLLIPIRRYQSHYHFRG